MTLERLDVSGHPLPRLHFDTPEPAQKDQGLVLAVERGKGGDEDAAGLDEPGDRLGQHGGEAAGSIGDEDDVDHGHAA